MKNKLLFGITVIALVITSSLYFERSLAQGIQVIANPDSGYVIAHTATLPYHLFILHCTNFSKERLLLYV